MQINLNQHIQHLESALADRTEKRDALTAKSVVGTRSFSGDEATEFDKLQIEIDQLNEDIARFKKLEADEMKTATPVPQGPTIISKKFGKDEQFEGQNFTRMIIAKVLAREESTTALSIAQKRWGKTNPELINIIKSDVASHGSGSGEAGAELVVYNAYLGNFIEYLYGMTVYDKLPLEEVPANVTIGEQDGAATAYWVGESKAIPATVADFNSVNLTPLKVATIAVASKEWLRDTSWSSERLVRNAIVNAAVQRIDTTFIGNAAGVAGKTPPGILFGIDPTTSAGTDGDALTNDVKELAARFTTAKVTGAKYLVMNPTLAASIGMIRNALGVFEFPTLSEDGGTLFTKNVVTGHNVGANHLIMVSPENIFKIGAKGVEVSVSDQASLEMESAPAMDADTPTAPTGKVVSLWQTESVGFKVVTPINFARRRESAVAWIDDADYGGQIST